LNVFCYTQRCWHARATYLQIRQLALMESSMSFSINFDRSLGTERRCIAPARLFQPAHEREYRALNLALGDAARRVSALRYAVSCRRTVNARLTGAQLSILRVQLDAVRGDVLQWSKSKISSKTLTRVARVAQTG
jgi:hypothetical protein